MKAIEKSLAIFFLIMGISIIFVWAMLLVSGDVPVSSADLFGWVSKLFLAVLSIVLSIVLFSKREWSFFTILMYLIGMTLFFVFRLAGLNEKTA